MVARDAVSDLSHLSISMFQHTELESNVESILASLRRLIHLPILGSEYDFLMATAFSLR